MTGSINKKKLEDISIKQAKQILNKNNITIDSPSEYGNMGLKKKEIEPYVKKKKHLSRFDKCSFKLTLILLKLKNEIT